MVIPKDPRWDFQDPLYEARTTTPNVVCSVKMSPADKKEHKRDAKRVMRRKSRKLFKPVDTEAPLARAFEPDTDQSGRSKTPKEIFVPRNGWGRVPQTRYIHAVDDAMVFLQTDGACQNNGRPNARAASSVVYAPPDPTTGLRGVFSLHMSKRDSTSNRAEMIAVLAAIRCRNWRAEGFSRVVIGTDSEWVVKGATLRVRKWQSRNWRLSNNQPVQNQDLWKELGEAQTVEFFKINNVAEHIGTVWNIEANRHYGVEILFWRLDRSFNQVADAAAKGAINDMASLIQDFGEIDIAHNSSSWSDVGDDYDLLS